MIKETVEGSCWSQSIIFNLDLASIFEPDARPNVFRQSTIYTRDQPNFFLAIHMFLWEGNRHHFSVVSFRLNIIRSLLF